MDDVLEVVTRPESLETLLLWTGRLMIALLIFIIGRLIANITRRQLEKYITIPYPQRDVHHYQESQA